MSYSALSQFKGGESTNKIFQAETQTSQTLQNIIWMHSLIYLNLVLHMQVMWPLILLMERDSTAVFCC